MPHHRPHRSKPMVGWFDIAQLWRTGLDVLVSGFIGKHADQRLMEAMIDKDGQPWRDYTYHHEVQEGFRNTELKETPEDYDGKRQRGARSSITIDYVADTGDGWNSTYAVAYALAHTDRCVGQGSRIPTKRGDILVFGGDEVYPTAGRKDYKDRLLLPYESAFKCSAAEHPHVLAIPGNHDWYDSLVSFSRLFIGKEWFAGWFAPQDRSYFACRLPGGWWLLGVDTQLGADIDRPQVEYFERVAEAFADDDKVILCCAEPEWIYAKFYSKYDAEKNSESNLQYLSGTVLRNRVRVFLSGDLHHYRRHANTAGVQKITCGGGGAFLHPTHRPRATYLPTDEEQEQRDRRAEAAKGATRNARTCTLDHPRVKDHPRGKSLDLGPDPYERKVAYPSEELSRRLTWGNLFFLFKNPTFGVLTAALYLVTALSLGLVNKNFVAPSGPLEGLAYIGGTFLDRPSAIFWSLLLPFAWVFFTDTHNPWYRWLAGGAHGTAHLLAAWAIGIGAAHATACCSSEGAAAVFLARTTFIILAGWIIGSVIMGLYLLVSLNGFGRHSTEAFSALAIEDHKCFLRLCIEADGALTIHPLKIDVVPRAWRKVRTDEEERKLDKSPTKADREPLWEPLHTRVKLEPIEPPFRVSRSAEEEQAWVHALSHGRPDVPRNNTPSA